MQAKTELQFSFCLQYRPVKCSWSESNSSSGRLLTAVSKTITHCTDMLAFLMSDLSVCTLACWEMTEVALRETTYWCTKSSSSPHSPIRTVETSGTVHELTPFHTVFSCLYSISHAPLSRSVMSSLHPCLGRPCVVDPSITPSMQTFMNLLSSIPYGFINSVLLPVTLFIQILVRNCTSKIIFIYCALEYIAQPPSRFAKSRLPRAVYAWKYGNLILYFKWFS